MNQNFDCDSCDLEPACAYPYKPTDCCGFRKFRQMPDVKELGHGDARTVAQIIPIKKIIKNNSQ